MDNSFENSHPDLYATEFVKLVIVVENTSYRSGVWASHGLSILVETRTTDGEDHVILFDTGNDPDVFLHNMDLLKIDADCIDAIVISHGHYDHTYGLIPLLEKIGRKVPVIMHPDALKPKYYIGTKIRYIGVPFEPSELKSKSHLLLTRKPLMVAKGIFFTGEIQRDERFYSTEKMFQMDEGALKPDKILDDIALVIGLVNGEAIVLTGCGHSGVVNIANHVFETFKPQKIRHLLGGFHLEWVPRSILENNWNELKNMPIQYMTPMHCSGPTIVSKLIQEAPRKYVRLNSGDVIEIKP
ncbi:MAG: MBL fold metallo-hydrolase [Candidatus Njordarchaeia archaeon]